MKKTICLLMTCVLLGSMSLKANAQEDFNGDLTIEEGANASIETIDNYKTLMENYQMLEDIKSGTINSTQALDYNTLSITCFQQETVYYCGPATVKQVVHFLSGSSNTQSYYATQLGTTDEGTDMTVIPSVIKNATGISYAYEKIGTESAWFDKVFVSVMNAKPAILDINTKSVSAFPYSSDGHFVNVSGYDATGTKQVRITDPYVYGLGNRWYNASDLYTANSNHWRQAILW